MKELPLKGVTVLEFSQYLAGPYAGLRLADLGARVIKIERPNSGDACRQLATKNMRLDGDSLVFHTINRNKESFSADLKNAADLEKVKRLISCADVMTHNFRPGVMEKIGLDYPQVTALNPNIIYGEVSGYGKHGPWNKKPGQDLLAQAVSGLTWLTGTNNNNPVPFGMAVGDMICGTHLAQGLLAALVRRAHHGHGAHVEVSLLESLIDLQFEVLTSVYNDSTSNALQRAETPEHAHSMLEAPYGIFATKDSHIALAMGDIPSLASTLSLPALAPYAGQAYAKRDEINRHLRDHLVKKHTDDWLKILREVDYWCSPVYDYKQLLAQQEYQSLGMEQTVARPNGCEVTTLRCPIRVDGQKLYSDKAAPTLGADNHQVELDFAQHSSDHPSMEHSAPDQSTKTLPKTLPLEGITVLDFSQFLSGPSASLRLADLGARVIKVEQPVTGDICRQLYRDNTQIGQSSAFFCAINRNKDSISLDLKDPTQRKRLEQLVQQADVALHNFRPGVAERLGIDESSLKQINPNLVYGQISGYGKSGSWANLPGQDLLLQSISGMTWLSGDRDDGPQAMGLPVVDIFSGAQLAQGILALLFQRKRHGKTGTAEVVMLESALDFQFEPLTIYFQDGGQQPMRTETNNAHSLLGAPYGVYACKNGYIAIAMANITELAELLECDTLGDFNTAASWFDQRDIIKQRLASHLQLQNTEYWLAKLEPADIWCAQVYDWKSLRSTEAYQGLDLEQTVHMTDETHYVTTRCPIRFDSAVIKSAKGAPLLGEHNTLLLHSD